ncbi:hypothetical protein K461DRAFT_292319 [Myriangium duriaei CBS 260.36]|uniref:Uncharacterized protein n=1 Tax=Myriangium duriaei CBS 260.36 TaxID=1168546 RepID=A0A9P4JAJ0_9PEZI|nr:hypothetical protein K461DRAFT_292319 [Myriangium duriaei CBS 260.36]
MFFCKIWLCFSFIFAAKALADTIQYNAYYDDFKKAVYQTKQFNFMNLEKLARNMRTLSNDKYRASKLSYVVFVTNTKSAATKQEAEAMLVDMDKIVMAHLPRRGGGGSPDLAIGPRIRSEGNLEEIKKSIPQVLAA